MSLDLDERQRAMLQEVGVRVWLPPRRDTPQPTTKFAIEKVAVKPIPARPEVESLPERSVPAGLPAEALDGPALVQAVAACQACQLCSGRRAPVFGRPGPMQQADWLVLGEPPDEDEEQAGSAFAGSTGQLLDNMLRALQLTRSTGEGMSAPAGRAYLSNVVKCRPAVVRIPQPQELLACEPFLQREIALVRPKVILAMGRFAAQALLQGSQPEAATLPLGKLRGQTYQYQGVPVIVTYHPGYLLRSQADKARAWLDLCRARAVVLAAASVTARGP